jgi:hypothetical protein
MATEFLRVVSKETSLSCLGHYRDDQVYKFQEPGSEHQDELVSHIEEAQYQGSFL